MVCRSCNGSWLDAPTVQRLKSARDEDIVRAAQRISARSLTGAPPDRTVSIACPLCKASLRRDRIPGTPHVIDVCDTHGAWFDGGAVDELQQFIAAFETIRSG